MESAKQHPCLIIGPSPHIHSGESISGIMWSVFIALIPSGIAGLVIFGLGALKIVAVSVASCMLAEALIQRLVHKKITVQDGSAALTGLLLAYNLSSTVPLWIPAAGGFFAIAVAKQAFGGLGMNIFNPALAARAFLMASWPKHMTTFPKPFTGIDAVTSATPLMMLKEGKAQSLAQLDLTYLDLFLGRRGGCIGEVCIAALLIGAAYLLWRRYISWHIPVSFILTAAVLGYMFGEGGLFKGDILFSILSGGLVLGAFFMATDYVTSPMARPGQIVFGAGCGLITFIIRRFGGYPEGVSYAILIMNAFVPLLDRHIRPQRYGGPSTRSG